MLVREWVRKTSASWAAAPTIRAIRSQRFPGQEAARHTQGDAHKHDYRENNGIPQRIDSGAGPVYIFRKPLGHQIQHQKQGHQSQPQAHNPGEHRRALDAAACFGISAELGKGQQNQKTAQQQADGFRGLAVEGVHIFGDHHPACQSQAEGQVPAPHGAQRAADRQHQKGQGGGNLNVGGEQPDFFIGFHAYHQVDMGAQRAEHTQQEAGPKPFGFGKGGNSSHIKHPLLPESAFFAPSIPYFSPSVKQGIPPPDREGGTHVTPVPGPSSCRCGADVWLRRRRGW